MSRQISFHKTIYLFSHKRELCGIDVGIVQLYVSKREREVVFGKIDAALHLIEEKAPHTFRELSSDIKYILVAGLPTFRGQFLKNLHMIELYDEFTLDEKISAEELACTLVHEAQHARLFRLGFGYDEEIRGRIERLCYRSARKFAKRLSDEDLLVARAEKMMEANPESHWSNKAHMEGLLKTLRDLECPGVIIKLMRWRAKRRAK